MEWFVYMLRCGDGSFYTGVTTDVARRLDEHRSGIGAKYTRGRLPLTVVWQERGHTESSAKKREAQIKRNTRQEKQELINEPS